jgi:hypothetical protein
MSTRLVINRMSASISGQAVTLTKEAGGVSAAQPGHLDASSIVVNTVANPAPAEFWEAAAKAVRYKVTIERES